MTKQAKNANKKLQYSIASNKEKTIKGSLADKEEREALESVKIKDNTDNKADLFLLSKQIDVLCDSMKEFDDIFVKVEAK